MQQFDLIIVGGGMVGAAVALGLAKSGIRIAIIEKSMPKAFDAEQLPDMRVSAISSASEALLKEYGAWPYIQQTRLCAYRKLAVWEHEGSRTCFDAHELGQSHLGHIVENRLIQLGLHQGLSKCDNVSLFETSIKSVSFNPNRVEMEQGQVLTASLILGADGANSLVRQVAGIGTQGWQYQQQAMVISIKTNTTQQDITWQRFNPQGPTAFLPLYEGYGSLVWYHQGKDISRLKALSHSQLKQEVIAHFPDELVAFEILDVASFPLTRMHANQYYASGVVLLGDAAHTINPLAGQGVNLGFKDVKAFVQLALEQIKLGDELGAETMLKQYEQQRRKDNVLMMSAMDGFYCLFSNDIPPLKWARNLGLRLAEASPLKNQVMKYAMGL